jgi:hypothetical protein
MMGVSTVELADGLDMLRPLLDRSDRAEGGAGWFATLGATTLRPGERALMAVLTAADGAALAGLPLVEQPGGSLRALTAPYTTRYVPPLSGLDAAEALGRGLRGIVSGRLVLDALDPADPATARLIEGMERGGLLVARYHNFSNWHDRLPDFDQYWARRPSELREVVRRKTKRLDRDERLRFSCVTEPAALAVATEIYQRIYAESWKEPEPDPDFIATMLRALAAEGSVRVGIAEIDGEAVAAQIWLVRARHATIFKLAHRSGQDKHSPGTLLSHWLMRHLATRDAIETIDFGRGDDGYKRQWMSERQDRIGLMIANPRSLAGLATALRHILPMRLVRYCRRRVAMSRSRRD